jgi:hypothetical protein
MNVALSKSWDPLAAFGSDGSDDEGDDATNSGTDENKGDKSKDERSKGDRSKASSRVDMNTLQAHGFSGTNDFVIGPSPAFLAAQKEEKNVSVCVCVYLFLLLLFKVVRADLTRQRVGEEKGRARGAGRRARATKSHQVQHF